MSTKIAWTNETWNPVTGCSKLSPGCAHCSAERIAQRFGRSFEVVLHPERLDEPLHWRKPRRVFVCSMGDLFHPLVSDDFIFSVWATMFAAPRHAFRVLTKRPERMAAWLANQTELVQSGHSPFVEWPLPNVWLGVSIENNRFAYRADILRQTPAAIRFVSAEPLLGPLPTLDLTGIDWLIIGGESGPKARPMDPVWAEELIYLARAAGMAVFVKQASGPRPGMQGDLPDWMFALREYPR